MSLYATEKLPQPHAADCAVSNDVLSRTLVVRLPQTEAGYSKLLWREAFQAYRAAGESGWGGNASPLWASALGADRFAYAVPGDLQTLKFTFPTPAPAYTQLISKPVYAIVVIDRGLRQFLNVRFLHRS